MLMILRTIIVVVYSLLVCLTSFVYCAVTFKSTNNVMIFGRLLGRLSSVFGLTMIKRVPKQEGEYRACIYVANHQNNYDMVTMSGAVQPHTVTVGKKSLLWIPFFGLLYWITGNILIDRNNRSKARDTIAQVAEQIQTRNLSIWMFPEGTRSRGRGILPFKMGAFHAAIAAGVPIVPVCMSDTNNQVNLNRWNNGTVIVEVLDPIDTSIYAPNQVRELAEHCRQIMVAKIDELTQEARGYGLNDSDGHWVEKTK